MGSSIRSSTMTAPTIDVSGSSDLPAPRGTLELESTISNVVLSPLSQNRRLSKRESTCALGGRQSTLMLGRSGAAGGGLSPNQAGGDKRVSMAFKRKPSITTIWQDDQP